MVTNSSLHYTILKHIIDKGYAPDLKELTHLLDATEDEVKEGLYQLQDYHGVVLHPHEPKVWVIHPFSTAPTNFIVKSAKGQWWGNCAWCSLGVAALLNDDCTITTSFGAHGESITIHIEQGEVREKELFIHFPVPMKDAWNNVIYTCSTMLVFKNPSEIENWTRQHHIPQGDIQPISKIWAFSKKWYGNHLNPQWQKWTMKEAQEIFQAFQLEHPVWQLETSNTRF
jgi:hypothetical protein